MHQFIGGNLACADIRKTDYKIACSHLLSVKDCIKIQTKIHCPNITSLDVIQYDKASRYICLSP